MQNTIPLKQNILWQIFDLTLLLMWFIKYKWKNHVLIDKLLSTYKIMIV